MCPKGLKGLCCLVDYRTAMTQLLLFLSVSVYQTSAASHSLRYISTAITPGTHFPQYTVVGLVDGEPLMVYDSNIRKMIPKTECIEKRMGEDYWKEDTETFMREQKWSLSNMDTTMKRHNNTEGIHTWQWAYGCELHDNGTTTAYSKFAYDGQDYIQLDMNTGTFTAHKSSFLLNWKQRRITDCKHYLETECSEELKKFVGFGETGNLERKVSPEVSLFQKDSSSPVVCHATGFFPKAVNISWQKNGEDLHEDVELRETLPNLDGTFQKRSILTVSPEELKRNQYSCIIQHSSLEKEMVLTVSDHRYLLSGGSSGELVGFLVGGIVAVLLLILICVGVFIWKKKQETETMETEMQETETQSLTETHHPTTPQSSG